MAQGNRMGAQYAGMETVLSRVTTHLTSCLRSNMTIAWVGIPLLATFPAKTLTFSGGLPNFPPISCSSSTTDLSFTVLTPHSRLICTSHTKNTRPTWSGQVLRGIFYLQDHDLPTIHAIWWPDRCNRFSLPCCGRDASSASTCHVDVASTMAA
jgi:hypothetical protein